MVKMVPVFVATVLLGLVSILDAATPDDNRILDITTERQLHPSVVTSGAGTTFPKKRQPAFRYEADSDDSSDKVVSTTFPSTTEAPTTQPPARGPSPCTDTGPNISIGAMWFVVSSRLAATSFQDCCDLCWASPTCNGFTYHPASLTQSCLFAIDIGSSNKVSTISGFGRATSVDHAKAQ